jgi:predicted nucleic acid-binding Zn ribbon protein
MERRESQSIGDVLRLAFQENCMQDRLDERKAIDTWRLIVGPDLAAQCMQPSVRNGVMTIGVRNASLRQELHMNRSRIAAAINAHLKRQVIDQLSFTGPSLHRMSR